MYAPALQVARNIRRLRACRGRLDRPLSTFPVEPLLLLSRTHAAVRLMDLNAATKSRLNL